MTVPIPRQLARRIRPALVVNTALATALLAVAATGDAARTPEAAPAGNARAVDGEPGRADGPSPAPPGGADPGPDPRPSGRVPGEPAASAPVGDALTLLPPQPDAVLADRLASLLTGPESRLSVSVLAMDTGVRAEYGEAPFDTASIVKVDVLAALLLQAQDAGRELTGGERSLAEAMIQRSDNAATDSLWAAIGGSAGLDAANERLGLTETTGGDGGLWGLTQTTSEDQIALLEAVFGTESALTPASRAYVQQLMGSVVPDQRWGISAAAEGEFQLKNGWLPRSESGLWDVNSIGRVTVDGRAYLIAVVSDGHATMSEGIAAVEAAARAALASVSAEPDA